MKEIPVYTIKAVPDITIAEQIKRIENELSEMVWGLGQTDYPDEDYKGALVVLDCMHLYVTVLMAVAQGRDDDFISELLWEYNNG
jgi:hypothetical protein